MTVFSVIVMESIACECLYGGDDQNNVGIEGLNSIAFVAPDLS